MEKKKMKIKSLKDAVSGIGYDTWWMPDNTLVLRSKEDKCIIGRFNNNEFIPLDDIAISLCEEHGLTPDESLLDGEDEEVEVDEDVDEEVDEEVEVDEEEVVVDKPKNSEDNNVTEQITKAADTVDDLSLNATDSSSSGGQMGGVFDSIRKNLFDKMNQIAESVRDEVSTTIDTTYMHLLEKVENLLLEKEREITLLINKIATTESELEEANKKFQGLKSILGV